MDVDQVMDVDKVLRAAPKVELHVHLDGAFDSETLFLAVQKYAEELPESVFTPWNGQTQEVRKQLTECKTVEELEQFVTMGSEPLGLFPMLDCFYRFLPVVRGRVDLIEELSFNFYEQQAKDNIVYTEVRYSPHELLEQDSDGNPVGKASAADACEAVCRGLARGATAYPDIVVKQILCCINMRPGWSAETVELAAKFLHRGVVGVDIASGEQHFDTEEFHTGHKKALETAKNTGFGITVHASEVGPAENVRKAVDAYGATRIGHGYRCLGTDVYTMAIEKGVHFEVCPTSSIATQGVDSWEDHPLKRLCAERTSCSVSTDDPSVFKTTLSEDLVKSVKLIGIKVEDVEWMTLEALGAAFHLPAEQRTKLEGVVRAYYDGALGRLAS